MTQDLTTRDIFQQLDTRLTRVEDDLRTFRSEVSARFERLDEILRTFRSEVSARFERQDETLRTFRSEVGQRFEHGDQRFDQLQWRMVGLFVVTWVTVIGSIWLKP